MKTETLNTLPIKTKDFINKLQANKIPLSQINTNDFSSNLKPSIYVTIPYGKNNGGKSKRISNNYLNERSLTNTVKFYHNEK